MDNLHTLLEWMAPGAVVYVAGSCAEPKALLDRIETEGEGLSGIDYIQFPIAAVNQRDLSALTSESTQRTFFMSPFLRDGVEAGRVRFIPMHMRNVFDYLGGSRIDVALLQAAPDREGRLRFGPNVDFVDAVLRTATHVAIEVNRSYTAPIGAPPVDGSGGQLLIEVDGVPPVFPVGEVDEVAGKIGELIASVIRDGDCLQTGIGAVPAAILSNLGERNDLGFHGGLMDDGVMALIRNGNLTGLSKSRDPGRHVLGMALGSREMLDWLAFDELAAQVEFRSADYTHEFRVISEIDNFVSVNSAVEIDLMGQVNAEVAGGRQISGTGGSVDFMRSARASKGGRSIVAMGATARGGQVSRIVPRVDVVTALRTDVDLVVTEFGIADLRNASLPERADRLIGIAHPDFRDELRAGDR